MRISDDTCCLSLTTTHLRADCLACAPGSAASISGLNAAKGLSGYESAVLAKTPTNDRPTLF